MTVGWDNLSSIRHQVYTVDFLNQIHKFKRSPNCNHEVGNTLLQILNIARWLLVIEIGNCWFVIRRADHTVNDTGGRPT
jgi:hypothetical protein